jgi:hypothetical protein
MLHNSLIHGIRMQMLREGLGDIVLHRPEQGAVQIVLVLGSIDILGDESLRFERLSGNMTWQKRRFVRKLAPILSA